MATPIDRPGDFKAEIIDYGLKEMQSGAVAVAIQAKIFAMWDADQEAWVEWEIYDQEATGDIWVIGKNGALNDNACKSLVQNAGWNGDLESLVNHTWVPTPCQVTVKFEEYNNQGRYKIAFVNHYERTPGGLGSITEDRAKQLSTMHGAALRALVGTTKTQAAPKPSGKPATPPKPPKASAPSPAPADEVPFICM